MAVSPGGVKHLCYLVSVRLNQRLRCREVRQQCAGGRAGGRVTKEGLELWERGRGDLLELVAARVISLVSFSRSRTITRSAAASPSTGCDNSSTAGSASSRRP